MLEALRIRAKKCYTVQELVIDIIDLVLSLIPAMPTTKWIGIVMEYLDLVVKMIRMDYPLITRTMKTSLLSIVQDPEEQSFASQAILGRIRAILRR